MKEYNVIVRKPNGHGGFKLVDQKVEAESAEHAKEAVRASLEGQETSRVLGVSEGHKVTYDGFWLGFNESRGEAADGSR